MIVDDPNLKAAAALLARMKLDYELHQLGVELTSKQRKKLLGMNPLQALERIVDLTSHITLVGPDGEVISPAITRQ